MKIEEKFEKGAADRTYQRIDSEYKVDIFLGKEISCLLKSQFKFGNN